MIIDNLTTLLKLIDFEEGDYYNSWGVTDHYDSDSAISLSINEDFAEED